MTHFTTTEAFMTSVMMERSAEFMFGKKKKSLGKSVGFGQAASGA